MDYRKKELTSLEVLNNDISKKAISIRSNEVAGIVSSDSILVLLTIENNTSIITTHIFSSDGKIESKTFDFSKIRFTDKNQKLAPLNDIIIDKGDYGNIGYSTFLHQVKPADLMSFEKAALVSKIYLKRNEIYITLDHLDEITSILSLNVKTGKRGFKQLIHATSNKCTKNSMVSSNSFLFENHVYQIAICNQGLTISIKDLISGKELQTFSETSKKPISIQINDPVSTSKDINSLNYIQKNVDLQQNFLKTLSYSQMIPGFASIYAYTKNDFIFLKYGGVQIAQNITSATPGGYIGSQGIMSSTNYRTDNLHPYIEQSKFIYSRLNKASLQPDISNNLNRYDPIMNVGAVINQPKYEGAQAVNALIFEEHLILGYYKNGKYRILKIDN